MLDAVSQWGIFQLEQVFLDSWPTVPSSNPSSCLVHGLAEPLVVFSLRFYILSLKNLKNHFY